jgi:hypothetical protein
MGQREKRSLRWHQWAKPCCNIPLEQGIIAFAQRLWAARRANLQVAQSGRLLQPAEGVVPTGTLVLQVAGLGRPVSSGAGCRGARWTEEMPPSPHTVPRSRYMRPHAVLCPYTGLRADECVRPYTR